MSSIYAPSASSFERINELVEWPGLPGLEWCRGFLAGIFDAEGSRNDLALRIANTDPQILAWTEACARRLGFDVGLDRTGNANGLMYLRIRGGLSEHLRFFHLTDPAITRKRSIEGQMVTTFSNLRVAGIEPLGASCRCTTSRRGPAISSPTASSATTASLAPRTRTWTSTPAGTSSARSWSRSTRPSACAGRAGPAVVEGRAHRAGDQHRPVSVGGGALQADAGDLGGDDRGAQPRLGADQVAAAARDLP